MPKFFISLRVFCWHPVVVVVVVVIIEEKGEIRSEYTAHRTRRTLADEGSGAEQHMAVGTWTASSCVSAQETEIWPNPEGKSGLGAEKESADCLGNENKDITRRVMFGSWGLREEEAGVVPARCQPTEPGNKPSEQTGNSSSYGRATRGRILSRKGPVEQRLVPGRSWQV